MSDNDVVPLAELIDYITGHFAGVDTATYPPGARPTAWFFSLDAEKHWPNFATIVTTDEHDTDASSDLEARRSRLGRGGRA